MHKKFEAARLVYENFWTVLSYALAIPAARRIIATRFTGEQEGLHDMVGLSAEVKADRALLELATQLRIIDDQEDLGERLKEWGGYELGTVTKASGTEPLYLRDLTNKVIHAGEFRWAFAADAPKVVCVSNEPARWVEAEIDLVALMAVVAVLRC